MAINNAYMADNGHLIMVKEDGTIIDAGYIRGIPGPQGEKGIGVKGDPGNPGAPGAPGQGVLGFKSACVDDGVPVQLDNIIVQLNLAAPRSLQFKTATGTMSVNISGQCYWANGSYGGNWGANYWSGNTLNTAFQQIFGWGFPWAGDKAEYNIQDLTNKRYYKVTLLIGPGYKNNYIVMERLV